jgi:hypothetical protein
VSHPSLAKSLSALSAICLIAACSSNVVLPPYLGGCMAIGDASCASPDYGGGSISGQPESGVSPEEDTGTLSDAGACGLGDLALLPASPACLPCISAASTLGCCQAALACSLDPICAGRVACASLGGAQGVASCAVGTDSNAVQFVQCLETNCSAPCSDIVFALSADQ